MECRFYGGIRLLKHAMKVVERIFGNRIRQQIDIDNMQFGFMKGKGTTDAIFIVRHMQEKFRAKGKKLYFGFVDLEKAFYGVRREVIRWAMRKLGVEEQLLSAVLSMYYYYFNHFMAPWTLSRTTQVNRYQEGKTNLDLLEREIICGSGISWAICKSALRPRQITMPASHHSVSSRPDALPATQPTVSMYTGAKNSCQNNLW